MTSLPLPLTATKSASRGFPIATRAVASVALALALIIGCGGWAMNAKLSGAVISTGRVVVKAQLKKVQHPEGGIVAEIFVENGDKVSAGDVLLRLDPTQKVSELGIMVGQQNQLVGRRARLEALRDDVEDVTFPADFGLTPETAKIVTAERRMFNQVRRMQELQISQMQSQIEQYGMQVEGLQAQSAANVGERLITESARTRIKSLGKLGLVDAGKIEDIDRKMVESDGVAGEVTANVARVKGQIGETQLHILETQNKTRSDAQTELRDVEARLDELEQRILAARDKLSRTEIRAPISGTVNDLTVHTVNGVISAGETVMSIVPAGEMTVEVRVTPTDIDQITVGQEAKLRFSAFNQRTTPEIPGSVSVVAAASTTDPATGAPYFNVVVLLDDIAKLGDHELVPGMPVEVFFQTDERTVISYLAKPFSDQIERAFREE
ncbi:MAG: HlyD family type I secretion periplasmic adaptor subunit [Cypionkella sp.]